MTAVRRAATFFIGHSIEINHNPVKFPMDDGSMKFRR